MGESSRGAARAANKRGAQACTPKGTGVHHILPFERWAHSVWPEHHAKQLQRITQRKLRTIKYQLAGRDPSYADIVAVLQSEHGFSFLQFAMADAKPTWWRGIAKARSLSTMRKQLDEQRRRIEQLELSLD